MWRLIIFLLFLIASVWVGLVLFHHPSYVFISYQPWLIQMPLWFSVLALVVLLVLLYVLINSVDRCQFIWFRLKNWLRWRREHHFYSKTQQGLSTLIEGRWQKAERLLVAGVTQSVDPLINYLAAAKAAQAQGSQQRCDHYLKKAYQAAPAAEMAIGLTQAELDIEQHHFEHAAIILNHLRQTYPRHPRVLQLLEKIYVRLADWQNLKSLLPSMRKAKLLTAEQAELFEKNIYCELLRSPVALASSTTAVNSNRNATSLSQEEVDRIWQAIPRHMKKQPDVVYAYVSQLSRFAEVKEIESLIRQTIKQVWHPGLVTLYGDLPFSNVNRQLVVVGAWVKLYGPHPELFLTLGKLCVKGQLWGRAKEYFEKCLALGANPVASLEYGKLLEQLGESKQALEQYQNGLMRVINHS
ncbi:MAG TPA: heme biosynthesis HemY N-terminal domain-containing protein [Gammaproteobacteria bacterium]|jgi:HemY protein|nr:heme biosynthesis HemY N-terminal domain-containing protein [Gammaproteobacteria bacterium]